MKEGPDAQAQRNTGSFLRLEGASVTTEMSGGGGGGGDRAARELARAGPAWSERRPRTCEVVLGLEGPEPSWGGRGLGGNAERKRTEDD